MGFLEHVQEHGVQLRLARECEPQLVARPGAAEEGRNGARRTAPSVGGVPESRPGAARLLALHSREVAVTFRERDSASPRASTLIEPGQPPKTMLTALA